MITKSLVPALDSPPSAPSPAGEEQRAVKWWLSDIGHGFTDSREQSFHVLPSLLPKHNTLGPWRCGGNGGSSELLISQTTAGNVATNKSENYVPGYSGNRIAIFPESKDVRNETKNYFKGQRVKGDSQG